MTRPKTAPFANPIAKSIGIVCFYAPWDKRSTVLKDFVCKYARVTPLNALWTGIRGKHFVSIGVNSIKLFALVRLIQNNFTNQKIDQLATLRSKWCVCLENCHTSRNLVDYFFPRSFFSYLLAGFGIDDQMYTDWHAYMLCNHLKYSKQQQHSKSIALPIVG